MKNIRIRLLLSEILESVASDTAHKLGLVGKGGNAYGPKGSDDITHHNVDGKLVAVKPKSSEPVSKSKNDESVKKDKSLKNVDTLNTEEFKRDIEPSDDEFDKRNSKLSNPIPPQPYKFPTELQRGIKFPKKYIKMLERMVNTRPIGNGTKISHFTNLSSGAGQISAQAGELMVMAGVSMSDSDFDKFYNSLKEYDSKLVQEHPNLKSDSARIVSESWIEAAKNNRTAILNHLGKEYGKYEIIVSAWDSKDDVESMGLSNYSDNKGYSTDVYFKLNINGKPKLVEVSLKKSTVVNLLNSGAGKLSDWDSSIPDSINMNVYKRVERTRLLKTASALNSEINDMVNSESDTSMKLHKLFKEKGIDFNEALKDLKGGKSNRKKAKVIFKCIEELAASGNKEAIEYVNTTNELHKEYQKNTIHAIVNNELLKEGMLNEIRSEFPLKSVSTGEESMAIGKFSLDKSVMMEIFGTDNYDIIKEKLVVEDGNPPYLGYKAEVGDSTIPLATINIREDGVGYGGQVKFEMILDRRFAKLLKKANDTIYKTN